LPARRSHSSGVPRSLSGVRISTDSSRSSIGEPAVSNALVDRLRDEEAV